MMTESTDRDQTAVPEEDVEGHRLTPGNGPNLRNADDDVEGHRLSAGTPDATRNDGDDDAEGHFYGRL